MCIQAKPYGMIDIQFPEKEEIDEADNLLDYKILSNTKTINTSVRELC